MADLTFVPAPEALDLLAPSVAAAVAGLDPELARRIRVAAIDPAHADTAVFCEVHDWDPRTGANCLIVRGTRGERTSYAAVVVPAHTRADVNRTVRSLLDARKATFAPMDDAVELTGMEHGGITPIGLPEDWRVLVDSRVLEEPELVIGAGVRAAKVFLPGEVLGALPRVEVVEGLGLEPAPRAE